MIKILFFIDTTLASGGAEKVLRELVNNMDQSKFDITVHTLCPEDAERYLNPGIRHRSIFRRKNRLNQPLFRIMSALKLTYRLYLRDNYDIEVAYLEAGPTKIIAQSDNKQALKLAWVHCDVAKMVSDVSDYTKKAASWYAKYDKTVCVCRHVHQCHLELFGEWPESIVLYNTVDDNAIREKAMHPCGTEKRRFTIATVGRLYPVKGYDRLLEAVARLNNEGRKCDLWILGEGPLRGELEAQIDREGLGDCVKLLGFQTNPYPFMREADVVVCSSHYEGFSTMVTEALILGKTVVTTPCSGMDELLGDSEYGLITEDSTDGIYRGLKKLLDDPALLAHYAAAAAQRGKAFSKEKTVQQTEEFFLRELEKKRNGQ